MSANFLAPDTRAVDLAVDGVRTTPLPSSPSTANTTIPPLPSLPASAAAVAGAFNATARPSIIPGINAMIASPNRRAPSTPTGVKLSGVSFVATPTSTGARQLITCVSTAPSEATSSGEALPGSVAAVATPALLLPKARSRASSNPPGATATTSDKASLLKNAVDGGSGGGGGGGTGSPPSGGDVSPTGSNTAAAAAGHASTSSSSVVAAMVAKAATVVRKVVATTAERDPAAAAVPSKKATGGGVGFNLVVGGRAPRREGGSKTAAPAVSSGSFRGRSATTESRRSASSDFSFVPSPAKGGSASVATAGGSRRASATTAGGDGPPFPACRPPAGSATAFVAPPFLSSSATAPAAAVPNPVMAALLSTSSAAGGSGGLAVPPPASPARESPRWASLIGEQAGLRGAPHRTSAEAHETIRAGLSSLLRSFSGTIDEGNPLVGSIDVSWWSIAAHVLRVHGGPSTAMAGLLFAGAALSPINTVSLLFCGIIYLLLMSIAGSIEAYLVYTKAVELRTRCIAGLAKYTAQSELVSYSFAGPFSGLRGVSDTHSFRCYFALRDDALIVLPKILLCKGDVILDRRTLAFDVFQGSTSESPLIDVMRLALERSAVMLEPLANVQRPPRLPNREAEEQSDLESDDASSDSSDGERVPRSTDAGEVVPTVPQRMEHFVHRVLLLLWAVAWAVCLLVGYLRYRSMGDPAENVLVWPVVATLGLVPLNAMLFQRILSVIDNVILSRYLQWMGRRDESYASPTDDSAAVLRVQPRDIWSDLKTLLNVHVLYKTLCLSRNPVETLGSVTVVAPLDCSGVLTDLVPLPIIVLFVNEPDGRGEAFSPAVDTADEDGGDGDNFLCAQTRERTRRRRVKLMLQTQHREFQAARFAELELHTSAREDLAVEFLDDRLVENKQGALNALALCVLLHSVHSATISRSATTASLRRVDRTLLWARCMHWLSRAARFDDRLACQYRLVRRVFMASTRDEPTNTFHSMGASQVCGLLFLQGSDLHLFIIGCANTVLANCTSYWSGAGVEDFSTDERKEMLLLARDKWVRARQCVAVACAHRVLPQRYKAYLVPAHMTAAAGMAPSSAPASPNQPTDAHIEDYYLNGVLVATTSTEPQLPASRRRRMSHPNRPLLPDDGDATEAEAAAQEQPQSLDSLGKAVHRRTVSAEAVRVTEHFGAALRPPRSKDDLAGSPYSKPDPDAVLSADTVVLQMMTTNNTFLGLVGLRDQVRPNVESAVGELSSAGIRFMHFGHGNEQHTKAFGNRIGIETDWNCCISLKGGSSVNLDPFSIRAQLPHGIEGIRRHIMYVDPIPLQVSLFSHCRGVNTRSMISLLQDNHEVVCVLGSALNHDNMRSFLQGDIALTVTPTTESAAMEKGDLVNRPSTEVLFNTDRSSSTWRTFDLVSDLTGSVCALRLPPMANALTILVCLIRESRRLLKLTSRCVEFVLHGNCLLALLQILAFVLGLPLPIAPVASMFLHCLVLPILALSIASQFPECGRADTMKEIAIKHNFFARLDIFAHSALIFGARYAPTVVLLLVCSVTTLAASGSRSISQLFYAADLTPWDVRVMRGFTFTSFVYLLSFHALTHISRHTYLSVWPSRLKASTFAVLDCRKWLLGVLFVWVLHFVFLACDAPRDWGTASTRFPPLLAVVVGLWPFVILLSDMWLKKLRLRAYNDRQKFRQLFFGTKLGMHSPRGDYEPDQSTDGGSGNNVGANNDDAPCKCPHSAFVRWLFRWTAVQGGRMDRNCTCCHWGAN